MESQLKHPQQHTTLDREDQVHEHGGEKQSVLKKVKAKAKKIKDTIKKHGHHHHHGHEPQENRTEFLHEEEDEDDDDDEYEEVEKDPEVHGAPIYESQVARNPNAGLGGNQGLMHHQPNMERTDEPGKDNTRLGVPTSHVLMHHQPNVERIDEPGKDNTRLGVLTSHVLMHNEPYSGRTDDPVVGKNHTRLGVPTGHGMMYHQPNVERTDEPVVGKDHTRLGVPTGHHQPNVERTDAPAVGKDHNRLGVPTSHGAEGVRPELEKIMENISLKEDVGAPRHTLKEGPRPGNYEAKVSDPTGAGAEETPGIAPYLHSLDKMSLDKPASGSRDQVESHDKMLAGKVAAGSHDQLESSQPRKYRDMPDDSPLITGESVEHDISLQGGGYGEKLAYATASLADKVVAAKDAAAAKLGYGDEKIDRADDQTDQTSQTSYTEKASHAASLLADKAVGVKDAVVSRLGYGGTEEHKTPREPVDHEALMQQSGYMGKVSGVTSALADKAVEAKNVVASKLGYDQTRKGDYTSSEKPTTPDQTGASTIADKAAQAKNAVAWKLGYDKTAGDSVSSTEPTGANTTGASTIVEKAAQVKNAVASKLGYDQTVDSASSAKPTAADSTGASAIADKAAQVKNAVASKLGYVHGGEGSHPTETSTWSEKLKPGDEDKALSELISGSVFKGSLHPVEVSVQQGDLMSMSKVTESEEVARRLGTSGAERKGDLTQIPGSESPKKDVVDKIKVALSTLWNSGDETVTHLETSTQTGSQHETEQSNAGVRRLQESAN